MRAVVPGLPRIALGCMRLSTDPGRDAERGVATLQAAFDAGVTVFDTARAYALDDSELGHNERLLARALRGRAVRILTKGGMRRPGGRWEPDGRARTLREDCEASVEALAGLSLDTYFLHAPDPRVPWATSVRALEEVRKAGLVPRIGLSNVTRQGLDLALAITTVDAVQVALGPFSDAALRGGLVARCLELGIEVFAHSPLGGPGRAGRLARDDLLADIAVRHGVTPQRIALEAISAIHPLVVPVVGARRPTTARAAGVRVELTPSERDALEARYGFGAIVRPAAPAPPTGAEVVLVMGLQGAGKSSAAEGFVARGYTRLNRDERGGTMRRLHDELEALIASGSLRVVADNTYTTRAQRQSAIEVARRRGARAVGVWLDVSLPDAQHNVILRMLSEHGRLLEPEEMDGRDPSRLGPLALLRTMRAIEPPGPDEGFASLETVPFVRRPVVGRDRAAMFVMLEAVAGCALSEPDTYVIGWSPGADAAWVRAKEEELGVSVRCCPHPGGPPRCWCRPPLPGLVLALAEEHGLDLARSTLVGTKAVHAALARAAGVAYRDGSRED